MLIKDILISESETIKTTLKKLDITAVKVLLVVDKNNRLLGTISDGDIRRWILKGSRLEDDISRAYKKKPTVIKKDDFSLDKAKELFIRNKIELIPILDETNQVINFVTWNQTFSENIKQTFNMGIIGDIPVVIMAGGKGTRMEPFSRILPKPLIPVGEKAVIEIIVDEFRKYGIREYYLTLNYKGKMIESYFDTMVNDYEIYYVWDNESSGSAGSLKLLEKRICETFIISNCDVIVRANFVEVISMHKEQNAALTILSSINHYKIPYGVINFKEGGEVTSVLEKPEYTNTINTGVYILSKESLQFIPEKSYFDMTDLIQALIKNNKKVITYPVNESDYIDIGQWEEYKKAVSKLRFL